MVEAGGGFSIDWDLSDNNVLARKGIRPGTGDEVVAFDAEYSANATA